MAPLRQIEAAELMVAMNNYTSLWQIASRRDSCVCRKPRPFDLVRESLNVGPGASESGLCRHDEELRRLGVRSDDAVRKPSQANRGPKNLGRSTPQTLLMNDSLTLSWKRSLMELTKIFFGRFHFRGMVSAARSSRTMPFQTVRLPLRRVSAWYFSTPMASSLRAISMA
jgi:hypothetical protein